MLLNRLLPRASVALCFLLVSISTGIHAQDSANPEWVQRSNEIAYHLLEASAQFAPEFSGQTGVTGFDEEIFDLRADLYERQQAVELEQIAYLNDVLAEETDPRIIQDIEIMLMATRDQMESNRINYESVLPYANLTGLIFAGFRGLLNPQVPLDRQQAALARLKKYTGQEEGYMPLTELARILFTERMEKPGLINPFRGEVEQDLERAPLMIEGMSGLFAETELEGYEADLALLADQLTEYNTWVKETILPIARSEARLPRELYELQLKNFGVGDSPEALIRTGQVAFVDIRNEMMALAPLVAAQQGFDTTDYREVIRRLKQDQIPGDQLMARYEDVMAQLDLILARENLATLPEQPPRVRMASPAETAQIPSAHLDIPRLVGNTGEFPQFVVPDIPRNEDGSWQNSDYAYPAMMWTLSAHEARPGHEMQFTTMIQQGVSTARAVFAFNSANAEGWGLYAESIVKPYMPLEGQLISLQHRLMRAARVWLDPMLNLGLIGPEEARRVLMEEVVLGEKSAQNEIDRYTFQMPGQATAYYYGYEQLQALRALAELQLKENFSQRAFHDFLLSQGLLPPAILQKAVIQDFIGPAMTSQ